MSQIIWMAPKDKSRLVIDFEAYSENAFKTWELTLMLEMSPLT